MRQEHIELYEKARRFIEEASKGDEIHIIAHRRRFTDDPEEYARKLHEQREYNHIPKDVPVLFLEIDVEDPSEFEDVLDLRGVNVGGHKVLRGESTVVPNAIAAFLLYLRDETGKTPIAIWAGRRATRLRLCSATYSSGRVTPLLSSTRSCVRPSRTWSGDPSSTSVADERPA